MKKVAGTLRLDLAQYREMQAFAQFASDLDASTQKLLARGERMTEILKQKQYSPLPVEKQVLIIFAGANGYVDDLEPSAIGRYEAELYTFVETRFPQVFELIRTQKKLTDEVKSALTEALEAFGAEFKA